MSERRSHIAGTRDALRLPHTLLLLGIILAGAICYPAVKTSLESAPAWQLILGSPGLLGLSAFVESGTRISWNLPFGLLLLFPALAGTALATAGWFWLLQRHEVGTLSLYLLSRDGLRHADCIAVPRQDAQSERNRRHSSGLAGLGIVLSRRLPPTGSLSDSDRSSPS